MRSGASGSYSNRLQIEDMLSVTRSFTVAEILAAFVTPIVVVAAPSGGKINIPWGMAIRLGSTGHTPYAGGGQLDFGFAGDPIFVTAPASYITNAADKSSLATKTSLTTVADVAHEDTALVFTNETGVFTGGTGTTLTITFYYFQV